MNHEIKQVCESFHSIICQKTLLLCSGYIRKYVDNFVTDDIAKLIWMHYNSKYKFQFIHGNDESFKELASSLNETNNGIIPISYFEQLSNTSRTSNIPVGIVVKSSNLKKNKRKIILVTNAICIDKDETKILIRHDYESYYNGIRVKYKWYNINSNLLHKIPSYSKPDVINCGILSNPCQTFKMFIYPKIIEHKIKHFIKLSNLTRDCKRKLKNDNNVRFVHEIKNDYSIFDRDTEYEKCNQSDLSIGFIGVDATFFYSIAKSKDIIQFLNDIVNISCPIDTWCKTLSFWNVYLAIKRKFDKINDCDANHTKFDIKYANVPHLTNYIQLNIDHDNNGSNLIIKYNQVLKFVNYGLTPKDDCYCSTRSDDDHDVDVYKQQMIKLKSNFIYVFAVNCFQCICKGSDGTCFEIMTA